MFRNRAFQVKMVKDQVGEEETIDPMMGPQIAAAYAEVAKDFVTHTALVVGGVMSAYQIIKRICK